MAEKKDKITFFFVRYFYRQSAIKHTKHSENFSLYQSFLELFPLTILIKKKHFEFHREMRD
jgi:hypothetical protein